MAENRGNRLLGLHKQGKRLTIAQMVTAKCAECMCEYADGRNDCKVPSCPLYPRMPYRVKSNAANDSNLNDTEQDRPKRPLTAAHLEALQNARKNKAVGNCTKQD